MYRKLTIRKYISNETQRLLESSIAPYS